eukprot:jgi/Botrbrau1/9545/Bobra.0089s0006.2
MKRTTTLVPAFDVPKETSSVTLEELVTILKFLFRFFRTLPRQAQLQVCKEAVLEDVETGRVLYQQGSQLQRLYLVVKGVVGVTRKLGGSFIKTTAKKGSVCGERWLLGEAASDETAVALSACTLITISRACIHNALQPLIQEQRRETALFLHEQVPLFACLRPSELQKLAVHATLLHVEEGACFDYEDDAAFIVRSGEWAILHKRCEEHPEAAAGIHPPSPGEIREASSILVAGTEGTGAHHARQIASLEAGSVFACGPGLAGTGEALRVLYCARGGSSLYRVNTVALLEHVEAATLQLLRDQVCLQLSFWLGRAGLLSAGTLAGHPEAKLMYALKKKKGRSKRRHKSGVQGFLWQSPSTIGTAEQRLLSLAEKTAPEQGLYGSGSCGFKDPSQAMVDGRTPAELRVYCSREMRSVQPYVQIEKAWSCIPEGGGGARTGRCGVNKHTCTWWWATHGNRQRKLSSIAMTIRGEREDQSVWDREPLNREGSSPCQILRQCRTHMEITEAHSKTW